jgi:2-amino-4-hydroxy-6-hydroxymethyldihydropteridine diphosphokinase
MIIISLGANTTSHWGNPASTILEALRQLDHAGVTVIRRSALYATTPMGVINQPGFVNAAAIVYTSKSPIGLLSVLKSIEAKAGRQRRGRRWGPRELDLDVIDYKGRIIKWSKDEVLRFKHKLELRLPHPQAHRRPFVLKPLSEIAPFWHHPVFGQPTAYFLTRLGYAKEGRVLKIVNA